MSCLNDKMTSFEHAKNDKKKQTYNVKKKWPPVKGIWKVIPFSFLPSSSRPCPSSLSSFHGFPPEDNNLFGIMQVIQTLHS